MRRIGVVAAAALLVLGMTGCASGSTDEPAAADSAAESREVAPLTAEKPAAEDSGGTPEEQYLEHMRARIKEDRPPDLATQIPNATDEQLLEAGAAACDQISQGLPVDQVRVIEGETPNQSQYYVDSLDIASAAQETLCP